MNVPLKDKFNFWNMLHVPYIPRVEHATRSSICSHLLWNKAVQGSAHIIYSQSFVNRKLQVSTTFVTVGLVVLNEVQANRYTDRSAVVLHCTSDLLITGSMLFRLLKQKNLKCNFYLQKRKMCIYLFLLRWTSPLIGIITNKTRFWRQKGMGLRLTFRPGSH